MNHELLLQHFDRISEAPDAIPRLRRFILDLAVRGKLVEQDPSDEPASELLKRIQAEKARLVKEGKIKKEKPLLLDDNYKVPFQMPDNWVLSMLDSVSALITDGEHLSPNKSQSGMFLLTAKHVLDDGVTLNDPQYVAYEDGLKFRKRCAPQFGDLLICSRGTIGRCCVMKLDAIFCLMGSVILVRPLTELVPQYLDYYLKSEMGQLFIRGVTKGMAVNALYLKDIRLCPIPLPPLAEQHRIVAKVDQLMALCDQLEAERNQREAHRDKLVAASLNRISSTTAEEAKQATRFHLNLLPRLTTKPEHIKQLRQTILNLAVRGKLVEQDPNDEPINETLKRVLDQRAALVRTKKVRQKKLDGFATLVKHEGLPDSWVVERLGNLVDPENTISYGVLVPGSETPDGVPLVRVQDLVLNSHPDRPNKSIDPEIEKAYARTRLTGGEILLCVVGSIGKLGVAPPSWAGANIARAIARIKPVPEICSEYLLIVLRGKPVQTYFTDTTRTLAQPTLNVGLIELTPIPLPPLAEQHRIVAKVAELMALCDQLEAQLTTTESDSRRLLEAVLRDALKTDD